MDLVVEIPADEYEIGDESVPNASPRHRRLQRKSIWIDARPVSWGLFEEYVAGGGYGRNELWPPLTARSGIDAFGPIDLRCQTLLRQSELCWQVDAFNEWKSLDNPATGLSWFEAYSVAKFYGARLPFEVEWEIAMRNYTSSKTEKRKCSAIPWCAFSLTDRGCVDTRGTLQEWTLDGFQPQYWRADFNRTGIPWAPETHTTGVSIRGSSPIDTHSHVCFRVGRPPDEGHPYRGFRRVWDYPPSPRQVEG